MAVVNPIKHLTRREALRSTAATLSAEETIGQISPGVRICGVTKGQFSLLDLLRAILKQTGPADVQLTTWSSGIRDAQTAYWLLHSGAIRSLRLITDSSFPIRQPQYAAKLLELFGESAIYCSKVHCKVALITNEDWSIVVHSSMNLNRNPRFEQFDLDDDRGLADWWAELFDEIREHACEGFLFGNAVAEERFKAALVDIERRRERANRLDAADLSSDPPDNEIDADPLEGLLSDLNLDDLLGDLNL